MTDKVHLRYSNMASVLGLAKIDYKGKNPVDVYKRISTMRDLAEQAKKKGDDENQYIMLRRWLDTIEWLQQTKEYKQDKKFSLLNVHADQVYEVKGMLAELSRKLEARYKQYSKRKMLRENASAEPMDLDVDQESSMDSPMASMDSPIKLPETPTKDPLAADNDDRITCDQLFQLRQTIDSRYLIIDVRSKQDYENSRILSDKCINIPHTEIKLGKLASHFGKCFQKDKESLQLFKYRGAQFVDVLVLLDWNTTSKSWTPDNPLNTLQKIFEEWDPGMKHKRIAILDGGYLEWVTRYPAYTTNPNVAEPVSSNDATDEILEEIEYPEWLHVEDEDSIMKTREPDSSNLKSANKGRYVLKIDVSSDRTRLKNTESDMGDNVLTIPPSNLSDPSVPQDMEIEKIPRSNKAKLRQYDNDYPKNQHKRTSSMVKQNELSTKPAIDRSNKPVSLETSTTESRAVLNVMRQLNDMAKNKESLQEEILEQERTLQQHGTKNAGSNEVKYINDNLKSLYSRLETTEKAYSKIEDDLENYCSELDTIKFNNVENHEKKNLEFNLNLSKRRVQKIVSERKKLNEKSVQNQYKELPAKEIQNKTHKEPLKKDNTSMNSGLERSYSSPNLLQLIDRKAPQVDRSSKPQAFPQNQNGTAGNDNRRASHLSWANREERMTPVHGSVHPGITGLKNLGNSCYMNSIIQCLSNTTHLAKYFTDNLYADDLNTNNESSTQGQVVEEVAQVIKALWRGQYKSISPLDLKIAVGQYKLQFESYEQQDSHEFLTFLLDWMHNDLKKACKMPLDMTVAEKAWDKAMASQKSIISDLFFGQLRSTITCGFCKQSSTTYETFNSLTTSLPHSNRCTLSDCILKFISGQKVLGWKCPKCQMSREATKKFDFVKLAPIIVIHLNRFGDSGGWLEKRNTAVDFPLTGLNLKPYLVTDNDTPTVSNMRSYSYSLYAMSNHYGTMEGGHYTAFCKNAAQNKWYKYDDQTVTEVTQNQVKSQNTSAYLLFYTSFASNIT